MTFERTPGPTPIAASELEGLIPAISEQADLNDWEDTNISEGTHWAFESRASLRSDPLTSEYLRELHRRMFNNTWKWAGKFRVTEKNIGVPFYKIAVELKNLLDDVRYWIEHNTFPADELAVRFHYRLVSIHPFPNGNGRHARLAADLLATRLARPAFSWGRANLADAGEARRQYLEALSSADRGDYEPLITFARS
jgi:Fic-DOC domain mobile mystery protein B